jgi:hypothetical protein
MAEKGNRIEETRESSSRDAMIRRNLRMQYQDPLYIDPRDIPPDMEYRWIRDSVLGQPDHYRYAQCKRKGWEPVPADRHVDFMTDDGDRRPTHVRGFIYYRGLILCEREKIYGDIERKTVEEENRLVQNSIPGQENFMSDPTMPMRVLVNESSILKTSKAGSFGD